MPPQNTIHSARTLHDLLNLFFVRAPRPSQSFQAIPQEALHVLSLDLLHIPLIIRTIHHNVRLPSAWIDAPGSRRRFLRLFSAIHHDLLASNFSAIHHDLLVPIFSAILHDVLVPIFSAILHDAIVFSVIHHDALVIFSVIHHDALVSSVWIDAPDCLRLNSLHPSACSCKRSG